MLAASAELRAGWSTQRLQEGSHEKVWPHTTSDCTALKQAFCLRRSLACDCSFIWRCLHCDSHVKVRLTETDRERGFGCIACCVPSPLCGSCLSCATVPLLAHSVHARMVKRRSEDDGLLPCFSDCSRPAKDQAGGRLPRNLRDGAAHDQTYLLAGVDVRHGTLELPGLAEPADARIARMAAWLRQPQQQRLIADTALWTSSRLAAQITVGRFGGRLRMWRVSESWRRTG